MQRRAALLLVVITACTSTGVTTNTAPSRTTGQPDDSSTTTSTQPGEPLSAPELPDPFDLAEEPLNELEVDGFDFADVDPDLVESVRVRLSVFGSLYSASVWDELVSDDSDEVVAFSLYPSGSARGDPALPMALAEALVEAGADFTEVTRRDLGGQTAYEIVDDRITWLLWANNTHLFVTAGVDNATEDVMAAIIDKTFGSEYQWEEGDCLYFDDGVPYAPFGDGNVVPCDGPHEWEVTRSEPLADDEEAPFPEEELSERVAAACEEAFFEFTGLLPTESALNQVSYLPDADEWEQGDRYFACIISRNDGAGDAQLTTGSLAGEATRVTRSIGDCYRRSVDTGEVDCGRPHVFEYIGMADYQGGSGDDYPGESELSGDLERVCDGLIDSYVTSRTIEGATIAPFPAIIGAFAWEKGVRAVPCFAYAVEDGTALEVVGSFSGGWGPLGDAGGSVQT